MSVRIGIDHDSLGMRWIFRGHVDGMIPVYAPVRDDTRRKIEKTLGAFWFF